jgi:hypothetical protein
MARFFFDERERKTMLLENGKAKWRSNFLAGRKGALCHSVLSKMGAESGPAHQQEAKHKILVLSTQQQQHTVIYSYRPGNNVV